MPSPTELFIVLLIVLLVFGAGKLPAIGDALGRSIKNFRRAASGNNEIEVSKKKELEKGKTSKSLPSAETSDAEVVEEESVKKS